MTKSEFQTTFGAAWAQITVNPAFFAAMQVVSADKLKEIANLSDDQIREHGNVILGGFRDRLQMENALIDLAVESGDPISDLPPETYRLPNSHLPEPPPQPAEAEPFVTFNQPAKRRKKTK